MTIYLYRCPECDTEHLDHRRGDRLPLACASCGHPGPLHRRFAISTHRPMQEHWNQSVNAPVSSMRDFAEKLKIRGEEYTARTGIESRFVPIDPADTRALGVTTQGIEDKPAAKLVK